MIIEKLHDEDYEYIKKFADAYTINELERLSTDYKNEQYRDCRGNTGLIQTIERAIDVNKARESRENFKNGTSRIETVFWSQFEKVDEAEEAAYMNLTEAYYEI